MLCLLFLLVIFCLVLLLGILLLAREKQISVTGVDIQSEPLSLARRAAEENGLEEKTAFLHADLRNLKGVLEANSFDLVINGLSAIYFLPFCLMS